MSMHLAVRVHSTQELPWITSIQSGINGTETMNVIDGLRMIPLKGFVVTLSSKLCTKNNSWQSVVKLAISRGQIQPKSDISSLGNMVMLHLMRTNSNLLTVQRSMGWVRMKQKQSSIE